MNNTYHCEQHVAATSTCDHTNAASAPSPHNKSLRGIDLSKTLQLPNTKGLIDEPGGSKSFTSTEHNNHGGMNTYISQVKSRSTKSYAEALKNGLAQNLRPALAPIRNFTSSAQNRKSKATERPWTLVGGQKPNREGPRTSPNTEATTGIRKAKSYPSTLHSNCKAKTLPPDKKHPRRQPERPVARKMNTCNTEEPQRVEGHSLELECDKTFYAFLANCKISQDVSNTLKRFLGFDNQGKVKLKIQKLEKALGAIGFEVNRPAKGSHVTYIPTQFMKKLPITFHWPHGANLEDIQLRDKSRSFQSQYPMAVNALKKWWSSSASP